MLVVFILLLFLPFAEALTPDVPISAYPHDDWGIVRGLPSDSLHSMIQTKDGYLWIATSRGLTRFNGIKFTQPDQDQIEQLHASDMKSLIEGSDGSLWIGTDGGGLLRYSDGKFRVFTVNDGLPDHSITALAKDAEGRIWIGSPGELCVYDKGDFYTHPVSRVLSLFADSKGVLIGSADGLRIVNNDEFTHYPSSAVTVVYRSLSGEVWFATEDTGLYKLRQDKSIELILKLPGILSIIQDRHQNLFFGTRDGLWNLSGDRPHPEVQSAVTSLLEDREGSLWVATANDGLHRLRPSAFVSLSRRSGLISSRTWCVLEDKTGDLWIGTDRGVSRWKDRMLTNYETPAPAKSIAQDPQGMIWIGTPAGIMRWNGNSFINIKAGLDASSIVSDSNGNLWIGAREGLKKFDGRAWSDVSGDEITALGFDQEKRLLVGTTLGLKRLEHGELKPCKISKAIRNIQQDRSGNSWVVSDQGVHLIFKDRMTTYATAKGLPVQTIFSALGDAKGNLWISSPQGIFRLKRKDRGFEILSFGASDGLRTTICSDGQPAGWIAADGKLWFATTRGIGVIDPENFFTNQDRPQVKIESMTVDRVRVTDFDQKAPKLSADNFRIEFQYAVLSFLPAARARYVLQGFDPAWNNASAHGVASYTKLPPGKYRFKVIAANSNGIWNTDGTSVSFEVESPILNFQWSLVVIPIVTAIVGFLAGWFLKKRERVPV